MDVFPGTLRGWDYGNGPDNVDSDHVFLGYDFASKFSDSHTNEDRRYCEMTIRFYVENLNNERLGCCNVKKCGVWCPNLELTREEKPESKKLKTENFYVGESSSR
ncbi:uncharacterized protein LOC116116720 isoform X2 [Pistacia vera]|nr:uncharacterized protein LOC116116720 isoform X2 [Pistacia vera]